jgi:hypothetical protein
MLIDGFSRSTNRLFSSRERFAFFQPVQLHLQPTYLFVERSRDRLLRFLVPLSPNTTFASAWSVFFHLHNCALETPNSLESCANVLCSRHASNATAALNSAE